VSAAGARAARGSRPAIPPDEVRSCVLLVLTGATVSKSAIWRAAGLAAGRPIVVVAIAAAGGMSAAPVQPAPVQPAPVQPAPAQPAPVPTRAAGEQVRRTVAEAMSAVEALGATALGYIALTRSPGRTLVRLARTRGARAVVLDGCPAAGSGGGDLAAELRRRVHGSGLIVEAAASERGGSVHALPRRAHR
jgi:hypothetical protein